MTASSSTAARPQTFRRDARSGSTKVVIAPGLLYSGIALATLAFSGTAGASTAIASDTTSPSADFTRLIRSAGDGLAAAGVIGLVNQPADRRSRMMDRDDEEVIVPQPEDDDPMLVDEDEILDPPRDGGTSWFLSPKFEYILDADFDDSGNDSFGVYRAGADLGISTVLNPQTRLLFTFGYEYSSYDFNSPNTFFEGVSADPFSDIHILDFGVDAFVMTSREWGWFAGVTAEFAGESNVDWDDAMTYGGKAGITWRPDDTFNLSLGIFAQTQIEDDALVLPAAAIDWQFAEQWALSLQGTRGELVHNLNADADLAFGAGWESRRFRLEDDNITRSAVVEESAIPVYVRYEWRPGQNATFELVGGARFAQEFEISDSDGDNERDFDADPSGFFGFAFNWRF
ncbi:MAG: DUF6268 family outer membrane beta-barrel protein [Planctomycetota bacterium]